ncbi:hypothetical protein [Rhodococcus sp. KRD162]|uniref:hypothetical protein n=1 Tax=Rhodococcus sp. KRD162 TaxID=2729725 RepID=UPI0019D060C9|nr:hypothetical protein [Rhodococcus sp. KRD162]
MRAIVFLLVLGLIYKWPVFGDDPGSWSAVSQGIAIGAIVSTAVTPAGWKALRRIKGRIDGSYTSPTN